MPYLRKYNTTLATSKIIRRQLMKADGSGFATSADWTPGAGDVTVSQDGAAFGNILTLPAYTNGAWEFVLANTELDCKQINVKSIDATIQSDAFDVETFGHASAMYPDDYSASSGTAQSGDAYNALTTSLGSAYGAKSPLDVFKALLSAALGTSEQVSSTSTKIYAPDGVTLIATATIDAATGEVTAIVFA